MLESTKMRWFPVRKIKSWRNGLVLLCLCLLFSCATGQPLFNSLATIFRPRFPGQTNLFNQYPNTANQNLGSLVPSGSTHQGILIAHPIKPYFNTFKPQLPQNTFFSAPVKPITSLNYNNNNNNNNFLIPNEISSHINNINNNNYQSPSEISNHNHNHNYLIPNEISNHNNNFHIITTTSEKSVYPILDESSSSLFENNFVEDVIEDSNDFMNEVPAPTDIHTHTPLKFPKQSTDFRPSPQIFDSPLAPHFDNDFSDSAVQNIYPKYESGFHPIGNVYTWVPTRGINTKVNESRLSSWDAISSSKVVSKDPVKTSNSDGGRKDRQMVTVSKSVVTTEVSVGKSSSSKKSTKISNETINNHVYPSTSTSSSELIEDWIKVTKLPIKDSKPFPVYTRKNKYKRPEKCEFQRYGFCGVDSYYPKDAVEKIASRCITLLPHIISPSIVNIPLSNNGTIRERYLPNQRGWKWKTYNGKPLCETLELKVTPGWAKDDFGDWAVVLQAQEWKQEAQVAICASTQVQCARLPCSKMEFHRTKCVQRFSAQRLAVLDPHNQDRCPVVKSVFLPSACICISDNSSFEEFSRRSETKQKQPNRFCSVKQCQK